MTNALLTYKTNSTNNIFNIGDYIQSLAARQFFADGIDCFICREELDLYSGDRVKMILNGWFMHEPWHWPPSEHINPLFVAFHINSLAKDEMLDAKGVEYFKRHQPIGCRDYGTVELLKEHGVEAYFTGCMTLTLGQTYKKTQPEREQIYFVDAYNIPSRKPSEVIASTFCAIVNLRKIAKLCQRKYSNTTLKNMIKTAAFYRTYSPLFDDKVLLTANYIIHEIHDDFTDEQAKFDYAEKLLEMYACAKFVVTSRIHCALPCLALETPVLYVDHVRSPEYSRCRLDGIKELFNTIEFNHGKLSYTQQHGKINHNTQFENKKEYIPIRDKITDICRSYIDKRCND